jgi:hypothetical protein
VSVGVGEVAAESAEPVMLVAGAVMLGSWSAADTISARSAVR